LPRFPKEVGQFFYTLITNAKKSAIAALNLDSSILNLNFIAASADAVFVRLSNAVHNSTEAAFAALAHDSKQLIK
jgi:hypothetical protein